MKLLKFVPLATLLWASAALAQTAVLPNYRNPANGTTETSIAHGLPQRSGSYGVAPNSAPQYCQITSLSVATNLITANCASGTILAGATIAQICVEAQAVRYTSSGVVTPSASVGMPVPAGTCFQYAGPLTTVQFIQQTSSAILNVETFP